MIHHNYITKGINEEIDWEELKEKMEDIGLMMHGFIWLNVL